MKCPNCGDQKFKDLLIDDPLAGFTIQTIVEGSDAEVNSDIFKLPVKISDVERFVEYMESESSSLWEEANIGDDN